MPFAKRIIAKILFGLGLSFAIFALICFSMPVVGAIAGTYEGGEQGFGMFFLYVLLAIPATLLVGASIWLNGWEESKSGRVTLVLLFGIPALVFAIALLSVVFDTLFSKKAN